MAQNNVEVQLQKAIEMRAKVIEFSGILTERMTDLSDRLSYYVREGFPDDIEQTYRCNYYDPDNEIITDLSKRMMTDHVDFLDKVIERLRRAKDRQ